MKLTKRYQATGDYVGPGSVFSERLNMPIEGDFQIKWDDSGKCEIKCVPRNLHPLHSLLIAQDFEEFRELRVSTAEGIFYAPRCFLDKTEIRMGESGNGSQLIFVTLAAMFSLVPSKVPVFWNAPVLNFLMDLRPTQNPNPHPIQVSQLFRESDSEASSGDAVASDRIRQRAVTFAFAEKLAFVEHLPRYEEAKRKLQEGDEQISATSMLVGSIPERADLTIDGVKDWFPQDAILALTLATGTQCSLGFIELRDAQGDLCQRLHLNFMNSPYHQGHLTVSDHIHSDYGTSGVGALISGILSLPEERRQTVRMLIDTIETTQTFLQVPDHAFAFIVRGLDGLANSLQLTRTNLTDALPSAEANEVKSILRNAKRAILKLNKRRGNSGGSSSSNLLDRIASRAEQAGSIEDSFGLSLTRVLQHFSLRDQEAIESYYAKDPRADGLTWNQALNKYRGGVIHRGFLDYSTGIVMDDVVCLTRHLLDVAIRVCLKEAGYVGTYNPFNRTAMQQNQIDWVADATSIAQFGFNGRTPKLFKTIGF